MTYATSYNFLSKIIRRFNNAKYQFKMARLLFTSGITNQINHVFQSRATKVYNRKIYYFMKKIIKSQNIYDDVIGFQILLELSDLFNYIIFVIILSKTFVVLDF